MKEWVARIIGYFAQRGVRSLAALALLAGATCGAAAQAPGDARVLDRVVADVCRKPVVLLGEDAHHASGRAFELKVQLVRRLIGECGFSAVFFEGQIYDFLDLERAFAAHTATPAQLLDAIGGLWSTAAEVDPLVDVLYRAAGGGRVRLAGLDPQLLGATQVYSKRDLPHELAKVLDDARREACTAELSRYANWRYDDANPLDDAVRGRLRNCACEIGDALAAQRDASAASKAMARNLAAFLDLPETDWAPRERVMHENFLWHRARLPRGAKVIVWVATVHAQRFAPSPDRPRLGRLLQQDGIDAATIAFSALSGSFGREAKPVPLAPAAPDSLEQSAFDGQSGGVAYIDRRTLRTRGATPARLLDLGTFETAVWAERVDGVLVLREERPPHRIRDARPQQLAPASASSAP